MELDLAFLSWVRSPGEHLSVFDNFKDLEECSRRTGANATVAWANPKSLPDGAAGLPAFDFGPARMAGELLLTHKTHGTVVIGDHNNPWFPFFPEEYFERYPEAFMRGIDGEVILLHDKTRREGRGIPMPAIDALPILEYSSRCIREGVSILKDNPFVTSWVIGSEEGYTDFLIGPMGDFRPAFWHHFIEWLRREGWEEMPTMEQVVAKQPYSVWSAWVHFREQAMADRAAWHMQDYLEADGSRPAFYPTHGSPFWGDSRWKLAQPASLMAPACDGLEMGHIPVDDDDERSNPLIFAHFSSYGAPVMVPRLGNRTVDFHARGLGRSFTPVMLRRLIYESLGMGAWHIGPIHWSAVLHDGEWFIKDTPAEPECKSVFREIYEASPILLGMGRLQPQVGLFASDETWLERWNPKWTGFYQDCLNAHWNTAIVADDHLQPGFAMKMPVLVSIDNHRISRTALDGLVRYASEGGIVIINGSIAVEDEMGIPYNHGEVRAFLSLPSIFVVDDNEAPEPRRLINEALSHTQGSHKVVLDYTAAPFQVIAAVIMEHARNCVIVPTALESEMPLPIHVNAFTLTDRVSLLCVLVNNSERYASLLVKPHESFTPQAGWLFFDAIRKEKLGSGVSARVHLARNDSALVWAVPAVEEAEAASAIQSARNALDAWKAAGCDTAFLRSAEEALATCDDSELAWMKAYSLAKAVLGSLCLRATATRLPDGALAIEAVPYDSAMRAVAECHVAFRLIPDRFRKLELLYSGDGIFRCTIEKQALPHFYDPKVQRYETIEGPMRVVIQAESAAGSAGGCLLLVK
jgi:hypothetical protein